MYIYVNIYILYDIKLSLLVGIKKNGAMLIFSQKLIEVEMGLDFIMYIKFNRKRKFFRVLIWSTACDYSLKNWRPSIKNCFFFIEVKETY